MSFKFSLAPVLKVRKHQEKLQKQKLAKELMKKKKIDDIKEEVHSKLNSYLEKNNTQDAENIHKIKRHGRHVIQAHEIIKKLGNESEDVEKSVSNVRKKLASAHKNRHMMEKLKETEKEVFTKKTERDEQKNMDEIATQSFSR